MSDPISTAIEAAVERAVAAQIPLIIEAMKLACPTPPASEPDTFIPLPEAAKRLGVHRSTIARLEASGKLPPRRRIGTRTGYLVSDLRTIMGAGEVPKGKGRRALR